MGIMSTLKGIIVGESGGLYSDGHGGWVNVDGEQVDISKFEKVGIKGEGGHHSLFDKIANKVGDGAHNVFDQAKAIGNQLRGDNGPQFYRYDENGNKVAVDPATLLQEAEAKIAELQGQVADLSPGDTGQLSTPSVPAQTPYGGVGPTR